MGIGIPVSYFGTIAPPANNFWDQVDRLTKEEIVSRLLDEMQFAVKNPIFGNRDVLMKDGVIRMNRDHKSLERMQITKEARQIDKLNLEIEKVVMEPSIAGVGVSEIADKITKGFKPVLERNIVGTVKVVYVPKPIQLTPEIILTLKLKSCSYLGDYGAGQTLETFSLLPGEKTTITIRNWERNEATKREASSVLDTISESSANELQIIVNQEASSSMSQGTTSTTEYEVNADVKMKFPKLEKINLGIDVSGGFSNSNTFSSAMEASVSSLVNSTSTQVFVLAANLDFGRRKTSRNIRKFISSRNQLNRNASSSQRTFNDNLCLKKDRTFFSVTRIRVSLGNFLTNAIQKHLFRPRRRDSRYRLPKNGGCVHRIRI